MEIFEIWYSALMCITFIYSSFVFGRNRGLNEVVKNIERIRQKSNQLNETNNTRYLPDVVGIKEKISLSSYLFFLSAAMFAWVVWADPIIGIYLGLLLWFPVAAAMEWGYMQSKQICKIIIADQYVKFINYLGHNEIVSALENEILISYVFLQADICGVTNELPRYQKQDHKFDEYEF